MPEKGISEQGLQPEASGLHGPHPAGAAKRGGSVKQRQQPKQKHALLLYTQKKVPEL